MLVWRSLGENLVTARRSQSDCNYVPMAKELVVLLDSVGETE